MEEQGVLQSLAEEFYLWLHQLLELGVSIYVEWGSASQQPECGYQPYESKAVVSVQVRYENMVYEGEVYVSFAQL